MFFRCPLWCFAKVRSGKRGLPAILSAICYLQFNEFPSLKIWFTLCEAFSSERFHHVRLVLLEECWQKNEVAFVQGSEKS